MINIYFRHNTILKNGSTPIYAAAMRGHIDVVKYLGERGAKKNDEIELLCELFNMNGVRLLYNIY